MHPDQIAPTLYFGMLVHFTHALIARAVGEELAATLTEKEHGAGYLGLPFHETSLETALNWLDSGVSAWVGS